MTTIDFVPEAAEEYIKLDRTIRLEVQKALQKLERDPRGYGDPLGNKAGINLFGWFSIRAGHRIRLIYEVESDESVDHVIIWAVGRREGFTVHQTAQARIRAFTDATAQEMKQLQAVLRTAGDMPS
ncbi:type II toxin-antitoxin system RelE family toxin [Sulfobacillus harzensis]|uniref:Type II toxin-antitoxin system RelE/ParE family toxin n=1 Tax=Sulfobacillus harzensis TaxID=2729629 RepID=A0A7Y0L330_9FIRM|nr:type II toxin-antitoxin system RelE/ParE family toxin [Sulfobacillus harzensis]NMP22183.1 type II toxin-antitoxin system RelE/ParE family toxin [Sulfobacillus harzensis]